MPDAKPLSRSPTKLFSRSATKLAETPKVWPKGKGREVVLVLICGSTLKGHINNKVALTSTKNKDMELVKIFTWNKPLYNPIPDPINWICNVLKTNTPVHKKEIALILLIKEEVKLFFIKGKERDIIKIKIVNITIV